MSISLMTVAWGLNLASTDKLVLLALADNANDAGCCWPSMATIARKCGLSERATRVAMRRLESAGHVSSVDRTGTSRLYTVHPGTTCPPAANAPRHDVPVTPAADAPKPSRTTISSTKTTSSTKKRARADVFELPDWVPVDAWTAWLDMRRSKGGKDTAYALTLAIGKLKELADAGHPPGAVLDQSTLSKWTKLYPIKDHDNGLQQRTSHAHARADQAGRHGHDALRGPRPDPAYDLKRIALAELEAEERAGADQAADRGPWLALPSDRGG